MQEKIAIIGGTGLTQLPIWEELKVYALESEYGAPSSSVILGRLKGKDVYFLPRHGAAHSLAPHQINYRANIDVLKQIGITHIIAVNAVGGVDPHMGCGHICVPDQLIDYTYGRLHTFFDQPGNVQHIDFSYPYSEPIRKRLNNLLAQSTLSYSEKGVYACTQGPRLETAAEIAKLAKDNCAIVGMTGMPEAALAREVQIEYASICLVVNPAAGVSDTLITMDDINQVIKHGMADVINIISAYIEENA